MGRTTDMESSVGEGGGGSVGTDAQQDIIMDEIKSGDEGGTIMDGDEGGVVKGESVGLHKAAKSCTTEISDGDRMQLISGKQHDVVMNEIKSGDEGGDEGKEGAVEDSDEGGVDDQLKLLTDRDEYELKTSAAEASDGKGTCVDGEIPGDDGDGGGIGEGENLPVPGKRQGKADSKEKASGECLLGS
jgi:hypothetical protein